MNELTISNGKLPVIASKIDALIDKFINAQDIKEKSRDSYRKALKQFFIFLKNTDLRIVDREHILAFKNYLASGKSPSTVSAYLTAVRKFFEWTESIKAYPNVAKGVKGAKATRGFKKHALKVEQVKTILSSIDRSTLYGKRDYAILNLLVRTGLRTVEVFRASTGDIRQEGGEALLYIQGKGRDSKDAFVLLTDETLKPINEYLIARGDSREDSPLFASLSDRNNHGRLTTRSLSRIVKGHLINIGLDNKRFTAHSFRHTAVTLSLLAGASLQETQALARHSNINTTLIYAQNIERIAKAPERKIDQLLASDIEIVNRVN